MVGGQKLEQPKSIKMHRLVRCERRKKKHDTRGYRKECIIEKRIRFNSAKRETEVNRGEKIRGDKDLVAITRFTPYFEENQIRLYMM